jgi:hypothetical protein
MDKYIPFADKASNLLEWDKCLKEAHILDSSQNLSQIHFNQIMDNFNHGFSKE